jgi:hypothetical protein
LLLISLGVVALVAALVIWKVAAGDSGADRIPSSLCPAEMDSAVSLALFSS